MTLTGFPWRRRLTTLAVTVAHASGAWAIVVLLSGGVTLSAAGHALIRSHDLRPTAIVFLLSLAAGFVLGGRRGMAVEMAAGWQRLTRASTALAALLALLIVATGFAYGSHIAGGSDAYGYVSQADLWARGTLVVDVPLAGEAPWPEAVGTFAPLGYRPATRPGAIVPVYSPGLPLMMAAARTVGGRQAVFAVVPVLGGLLVWAGYLLGRRLGDRRVGIATAALLASSPITLFQVVQPMSDVPVAAWWTLALVASSGAGHRHAAAAGVAAALAILTRPNLVPLALAPLISLAWQRDGRRLTRLAVCVVPIVVSVLAVMALNAHLYGSPFLSGYGPADYLYQAGNIAPNVVRYATWSYELHGLLFLLACAAPLAVRFLPEAAGRPGIMAAAVVLVALCVASYLPYAVFDNWTYLRFLLPGLGPVFALVALVFVWLVQRLPTSTRLPAFLIGLVMVSTLAASRARDLGVFDLHVTEQVYVVAAEMSRDIGGRDGVFLAMQHSGSLRYYGDVLTLRWDGVDPAWLDRLVAWWHARGRAVYFVLEDWEQVQFKERFAPHSPLGRLDWPARGEAKVAGVTSVYDVSDRERYLAGDIIPTIRYFARRPDR